MSLSTLTSERITAVVSTLMAIAILAAGVTAQHSRAPLDEIEQLESDLQFQLDWAFRHDSKERSKRIARLEETISAWHESPGSEGDRKLLASWLLESTIRSMPGTIKPFPSVPEFSKPADVVIAESVETVPVEIVVAQIEPHKTEPTDSKVVPLKPTKHVAVQVTEAIESPVLEKIKTPPANDHVAAIVRIAISKPAAHSTDDLFKDPPEEMPQGDVPQFETSQLSDAVEPTEKPVRINLNELAARIAGYHEGLDQIETELLLASSPDLDFFAEQIQKLDHLTRDYGFVELYYEALSEQEQKHIRTPRWMNATLGEIERLLQRHESKQDGDFLGSFDPAQIQQIEELRQQLAKIADFKSS